jgi:hypothetical protein
MKNQPSPPGWQPSRRARPAVDLDQPPRAASAFDMDQQEEAARPFLAPLQSAYRVLLGTTPSCRPGDVRMAARFVRRIEDAQAVGGWTRSEQARLSRLKQLWLRRAKGVDSRFMVAGNRAGRLTSAQLSALALPSRTTPLE